MDKIRIGVIGIGDISDVYLNNLKKYDAVKTHHAAPMAKVENNQCGGCNMSLPTATVKRVAAGTGLVECENCGRILYTQQ